jgi:hypothetical protein
MLGLLVAGTLEVSKKFWKTVVSYPSSDASVSGSGNARKLMCTVFNKARDGGPSTIVT